MDIIRSYNNNTIKIWKNRISKRYSFINIVEVLNMILILDSYKKTNHKNNKFTSKSQDENKLVLKSLCNNKFIINE